MYIEYVYYIMYKCSRFECSLYLEFDDVAGYDHTYALNEITNDVNEGSTDVDVL